MSFSTITESATQSLQQRVQGSWFNADGTPKKNYIWKQSDNTPKGDGGEGIVADTLEHVFTKNYPSDFVVDVNVVGAEKGDYDVIVEVYDAEGNTVNTLKIEVYSRWGNLVWESTDLIINWDGNSLSGMALPSNTYYYILSLDGGAKTQNGPVILLR